MNFVAAVYPLKESCYINSINQALCKLGGKRELISHVSKSSLKKWDYGSCEGKKREQYRATAGWKALLAKAASLSKAFTAELKIYQV